MSLIFVFLPINLLVLYTYIYILFKFPQIVLALHGLFLKKQAGSQDTLTLSPSADSTKKPGSISRTPKRSAVAEVRRHPETMSS